MRIAEYSKQAAKTAIYPGKGSIKGLLYTLVGLSNEAGEALGHAKKILRGDDSGKEDPALHDEWGFCSLTRKKKILAELGDVAWYWSMIIQELGADPETILRENLKKLNGRQRAGTLKGDGDNR